MKTLVLVKKTPDTETKIVLSGNEIDHSSTKFIVNPYDEFAIEEALKVREKAGGEVVIVSFGSDDTRDAIIRGLAMGADRGILVSNQGLESADSLTVAKILSSVAKEENADLIFCGKQGIDEDNMHGPTMVAELLGWPHVNVVNKLELEGEELTIEREVEGGQVEIYEAKLPVVIGANKALNEPRYTSLPNIIKAKKKPLDSKAVSDYGLDSEVLKNAIQTEVKAYNYPPEKEAGEVFQGEDLASMVDKLVTSLRDKAKAL